MAADNHRKKINFRLTKEDKEYIKETKLEMMEGEADNKKLFGNPDRIKYYAAFNDLDDWEKNLIILYIKYQSYTKVAQCLNVQSVTTALVIKEIIAKLNYIINDKDTSFY